MVEREVTAPHPMLATWQTQFADLQVLMREDRTERSWLHGVRARVLEYLISRYRVVESEGAAEEILYRNIPTLHPDDVVTKIDAGSPPKTPQLIRQLLFNIRVNANWAEQEQDLQVG